MSTNGFGALLKGMLAAALAAALLTLAAPRPAEAGYVQVGVLECIVQPGIGLIVVSSKALACTLSPGAGPPERYTGRINKVGIDIGFTGRSVIIWAVFSAQSHYSQGSIAGTYVGLSAQASVAIGLGANVLLGGSGSSLALQPLSVQAQLGLNLAAGVTGLTLVRR
jgi:hypothetical protein